MAGKVKVISPKEGKQVKRGYEISTILLDRKDKLEKIIKDKKNALAKAPDGYLRVLDRKTYVEYYWRKNPRDTNGEFIPKKDWKIARRLAQKDYDTKMLNLAEHELKLVKRYLEYGQDNDMTAIYDNLSSRRKELVIPYSEPDEMFVKNWMGITYEPMGFDEDYPEYYSDNGIRVRSKSEIIIANMLEKYQVPFRYEYPMILDKRGMVRPDFTCLNIRKRKEFIWEHFGMMDDEEYAQKNVQKINSYEENGFHAGINMIMTFETSLTPINSNIIRTMIENYLL
jgi:hypothetical protein